MWHPARLHPALKQSRPTAPALSKPTHFTREQLKHPLTYALPRSQPSHLYPPLFKRVRPPDLSTTTVQIAVPPPPGSLILATLLARDGRQHHVDTQSDVPCPRATHAQTNTHVATWQALNASPNASPGLLPRPPAMAPLEIALNSASAVQSTVACFALS